MSLLQRYLIFVLGSAVLWCVFVPLYSWVFVWAEFAPGINMVYLPHGIRMVLVLLFGVAGALGFSLGARLLTLTSLPSGLPNESPTLELALAVVPGLAAWLAARLTLKDWPGRYLWQAAPADVTVIGGSRLLLLAFVSAVLNSAGHGVARLTLGNSVVHLDEHFLAMFLGDLLGALTLLYGLSLGVQAFERARVRNRGT
ncbi:MAG: hypothetical protein FJ184_03860 [Gammaproteobacteria bacterium]|nr:hypothetical protein [Gammaproteobacteria bacterium]MBM4234019.1 hypothetical protein [Gammaproteobacteria bacterium]